MAPGKVFIFAVAVVFAVIGAFAVAITTYALGFHDDVQLAIQTGYGWLVGALGFWAWLGARTERRS